MVKLLSISDMEGAGRQNYWLRQRSKRQREVSVHAGEVLWSALQQWPGKGDVISTWYLVIPWFLLKAFACHSPHCHIFTIIIIIIIIIRTAPTKGGSRGAKWGCISPSPASLHPHLPPNLLWIRPSHHYPDLVTTIPTFCISCYHLVFNCLIRLAYKRNIGCSSICVSRRLFSHPFISLLVSCLFICPSVLSFICLSVSQFAWLEVKFSVH